MQNLWTVEVSHALHFGNERSVQPVQKPGASCLQSTQLPDVLSVRGTLLDLYIKLAEALWCLQCYIFQVW